MTSSAHEGSVAVPSLKHRIQFYNTLATLEDAGVPPMRCFAQRMPGSFQRLSRDIQVLLKQGETVSEAMARFPRTFSGLEINLVQVGEATGRRDTVYRSLRDWFQLVNRLRGTIISGLIYPAMVYHAAALLIPLITVFTDGVSPRRALVHALMMLAAPWCLLLLGRTIRSLGLGAGVISAMALELPLIGGLIYRLDCTRFFMALALCLRSGLGGINAVEMAAACCRNPRMQSRFKGIAALMRSEGCPFSDALARQLHARDRRSMILELMRTGEMAGTTDEAAERIAKVCQEEAETIMTRVAVVLPTIVYLCIALYLAWKIIGFYGKLLAPVRDLL